MIYNLSNEAIPMQVCEGLLMLLRARVVGFDTLVELTQKLSMRGASRLQIMDFYYRLIRDYGDELEEDQIDMIGDINIHLSGQQCPIDQIIRLVGDPEDPMELYGFVREQMKKWAHQQEK